MQSTTMRMVEEPMRGTMATIGMRMVTERTGIDLGAMVLMEEEAPGEMGRRDRAVMLKLLRTVMAMLRPKTRLFD